MLLALSAFAGPTLAVLPFDNHSGDPAYDALGRGIADMMVTDLARVSELSLVERSRIQDVLAEVELGEKGFLDKKTAARAGKGMGADFLVVGAINAVEPVLRVDARVVAVRSGRVTWTAAAEGERVAFFEVEKDLVLTLLEEMEIEVSAREAMQVGRVATESFDALLDYSRGLEALDSGAVAEAEARFRRAVETDAGFGAAKQAIEQAREQMETSTTIRREAYSEGLQRVLPRIAGFRTGDTSKAELEALTLELAAQVHGFAPEEQRVLALAYLELDLPDTVQLQFTPPRPVNEWAIGNLVMVDVRLQRGAELATWATTYLERYPTGGWFTAVKSVLDQRLKALEKQRQALDTGVPTALEKKHTDAMHDSRCRLLRHPRERHEACAKFFAWRNEHLPEAWDTYDLRSVLRAVVHQDPELAEKVLERWRATQPDPPGRRELGELEGRAGERKRAEEMKRRAESEQKGAYWRSAIDAWIDIGEVDEALRLLDRMQADLPQDPETFRARWRTARSLGDPDGMQQALDDANALGLTVGISNEKALEDLEDERERRHDADHADAERLYRLAQALGSAGLYRRAALTWDELVETWPDWRGERRERVLSERANAWAAVFEPEAYTRAIAAYRALIEAFPDSTEAGWARNRLDQAGVRP